MPEFRMSGDILLLPLLAFMARVGIASSFIIIIIFFFFFFLITTFLEQTYSWKADSC
jgi:hypothetical protein